jgi:hypothetical protein
LVLVDTQGQLMARRDEMRGLNEYLAHLAKCLPLASQQGHRTIGLEYGKATAGPFLATALATDFLVGLPGTEPVVMALPSISRVTKLPCMPIVPRGRPGCKALGSHFNSSLRRIARLVPAHKSIEGTGRVADGPSGSRHAAPNAIHGVTTVASLAAKASLLNSDASIAWVEPRMAEDQEPPYRRPDVVNALSIGLSVDFAPHRLTAGSSGGAIAAQD